MADQKTIEAVANRLPLGYTKRDPYMDVFVAAKALLADSEFVSAVVSTLSDEALVKILRERGVLHEEETVDTSECPVAATFHLENGRRSRVVDSWGTDITEAYDAWFNKQPRQRQYVTEAVKVVPDE